MDMMDFKGASMGLFLVSELKMKGKFLLPKTKPQDLFAIHHIHVEYPVETPVFMTTLIKRNPRRSDTKNSLPK